MSTNIPIQNSSSDLVAQAKQLGLGVATLTAKDIETAPTNIMPLAEIENRKIFPYRFDESTKVLSVAVADPTELKKPAPTELQAQRKLGRTLKLELVDPISFSGLLSAIKVRFAGSDVLKSSELAIPVTNTLPKPVAPVRPQIDLKTISIPRSVFLKIPHDVATKFRVLVYEALADSNHVKLASDRPDDAGVKRVVSVIRDKRGVTADVIMAPTDQIDQLLKEYQTSNDPISLTPSVPAPVKTSVPIKVDESPSASLKQDAQKADLLPITEVSQKSESAPSTTPLNNVPSDVESLPPLTNLVPKNVNPLLKPLAEEKPVVASSGSLKLTPVVNSSVISPKPDAEKLNVESMPVDNSPVTKKLDPTPAKIELTRPNTPPADVAAPVEKIEGSAFPLPKISMSAANAMSLPIKPLAAPLVPNKPNEEYSSLPKPSIEPVKPLTVSAPISNVKPIEPLQVNQSPIEVKKSEVQNIATFSQLSTIDATEEQDLDKIVGSTVKSAEELEAIVRTGLVPKILAGILQYAVGVGASDIHVEAEQDSLRVRFRVDGILRDMLKTPLGLDAPFVSRVKILSGMKIDEQRVPQDGRFSATTAGREVDFRVSTLPAIHGEKLVLRILDKSMGVRAIDQLGMDGSNAARLAKAIEKPFGIILVTGPTGSGKTTTLYSMLGTLNKPGVNIITLEDPVEYELSGITQTQVKPKIGFSFAEGLRSVLRQDPDIIMVGEIRDKETASLATNAALTGHLVLSTLHTNNAAGAIPRFLNMGVEPFLVASSIDVVVGQRLVRKLCEKCKQPATVSAAMQKDITDSLNSSTVQEVKNLTSQPMKFYAPKGCAECHEGYRGRLGVYEVMTVSPEIESLTANKGTIAEIQAAAVKDGMVTMKQDGIIKALSGQTSLDEIYRVTTGD